MAFEEVVPRSRTIDDIKVYFTVTKSNVQYANIVMSSDFITKLGWNEVSKVKVYVDKEDHSFMIEDISKLNLAGYKLSLSKNNNLFKVQFKAPVFSTPGKESTSAVYHEFVDGKLIIKF